MNGKEMASAQDVHGEDGLGGITKSDHLLEVTRTIRPVDSLESAKSIYMGRPEKSVHLVFIGPVTNFRTLVDLYGSRTISRVTVMGGCVFDFGNVSEWAEFNAYCDPEALQDLLMSGHSIDLVPLDVCRKVVLTASMLEDARVIKETVIGADLIEAHEFYQQRYNETDGFEGFYPHDSIALASALHPEFFRYEAMELDVVLTGGQRGRTRVINLGGDSSIRVAMGVRLPEMFRFLLT